MEIPASSQRLIDADNARKQLAVTIADELIETGGVSDLGLLMEYRDAVQEHQAATEAFLTEAGKAVSGS